MSKQEIENKIQENEMRPIDRPYEEYAPIAMTVAAVPMSRLEYNEYRGWDLPEDEDGDDAGYLMVDKGGESNTPDFDGYVRWLPKSELERSHRNITDGVPFGVALDAVLNHGMKAHREGWNGKQQYIFRLDVPADEDIEGHGEPFPHVLCIRTTNGMVQLGWLASQSDMMSSDWHVMV